MPSRSDDGTACKIVSVPKEDSAEGIPGANVVLNQESGRLEAVIASGELTGVRTAAGSAVASRLLLGEGKERKKVRLSCFLLLLVLCFAVTGIE
jgi:ornithine cyclodeaminase/alanine dehydrogenase-like protein (mu-crystallin family)